MIARLSEDVPEVVLLDMRGRTIWRDAPGGVEIATEKLSMRLKNGLVLQPTDFYFLNQRPSEQLARGQIDINLLHLDQIVSLTEYIPLNSNLREQLANFSPSGKVSNWKAKWTESSRALILSKSGGRSITSRYIRLGIFLESLD